MTNEIVKEKQIRDSSIELLRIIAMIMIVFYHFAIHGAFKWGMADITISHFWYNLIAMGGKIGVDIFVLISGYFLVTANSDSFNFRKILRFWGQVFFYSVLCFVVGYYLGTAHAKNRIIISTLFPITCSKWWFASTYFILYLLHPFLNKLLYSLDKKSFQKLLMLLVFFWSLVPTFTRFQFESNRLLWFITLYTIAGYARLYGFNKSLTAKHYLLIAFLGSIFVYASSIYYMLIGDPKIFFFYTDKSIFILLISVSLLMFFASLKMKYHKWINLIASASFGVYLIHDNQHIRRFLWIKLFKQYQYQDSAILIPYSILVILTVYTICTIVELVRQKTFGKFFTSLFDKYSNILLAPIFKVTDATKSIIFGK